MIVPTILLRRIRVAGKCRRLISTGLRPSSMSTKFDLAVASTVKHQLYTSLFRRTIRRVVLELNAPSTSLFSKQLKSVVLSDSRNGILFSSSASHTSGDSRKDSAGTAAAFATSRVSSQSFAKSASMGATSSRQLQLLAWICDVPRRAVISSNPNLWEISRTRK